MNIAVYLSSGTLSGAEKRAAKICNDLIARGHVVTLFVPKATHTALVQSDYRFVWPPTVIVSQPLWLRMLSFGKSRAASLRRQLKIDKVETWARRAWWGRLLRRNGIEVVHIYLAWRRCLDLPIPHLFEITSPDMARLLSERNFTFPQETLLHPNSEGVGKVVREQYQQNKIMVPPHAYFDPHEPEDFRFPSKENIVVFGHRLIDRKNPLIFARAAKRFVKARPEWRVMIRGVGPLSDPVRNFLEQEIESGRVIFGFNPNLMEDLYISRVFVSIESEDNYSNQSVLEAMWCHNALVLSDRGHTRARYFADNGVFCEPEEHSVFNALLSVTADTAALEKMGENGRLHVESAFSREAYLDHLEAVYQAACTQWMRARQN